MKIIVTGGTGFLGRHLVWQLAKEGHELIFTGRQKDVAQKIIATAAQPVQFVPIEHGSTDAAHTLRACSHDADIMIHCAALASPWGSHAAFWRANVESTREVLAACQHNGIEKLVHISSPSVYFDYRDRIDIREDEPLPYGVNEYARSKKSAEQLVSDSKLPHRVILRPRAIFGPWDNALLPRLLRLMRYGRIPLLRGGRALLDMTYVDNVVHAVQLAIKLSPIPAPDSTAQIFNISNGEPIAAADLFTLMAQQFGMPLRTVHRPYALADMLARIMECGAKMAPGWEPPFTRYSLATIAFSQTLDLNRAQNILGYQPRISLSEGITLTAQWWREQEHSI